MTVLDSSNHEDGTRGLPSCASLPPAVLASYLECRLPAARRAIVEWHLADCDICRSVLTRAAALDQPSVLPS